MLNNNNNNNNSADANNGQAEDGSRVDDIGRTTDSISKRQRRSNDDDESKAKVDKDTDEQQAQAQAQAEEQVKDKGDNIQLGIKTPVLTKTYDGGTSRDDATIRRANDPWPRDCNGRRRTRLSTEQHVSTILDDLNLN